jgi:hypothetical protein
MSLTYELATFRPLVLPDYRLLGGWKINAGGYAIPTLPVGPDLKMHVRRCDDKLSEEDSNDLSFAVDSEL